MSPLRITVWNEFRHERTNEKVIQIYPKGIHEALAAPLREAGGFEVATATLDEPEHGLSDARLDATDVLLWWSHMANREVSDERARQVVDRVWKGMGLVVLHSGLLGKPFKLLMGTSGELKWREAHERELLWVTKPGHPVAEGLGDHFSIEAEEMYGEPFDVPEPEATVFISSFPGGEVFRSGCCWTRGAGKIFYFRPGHETYPTYYDKNVQRVIRNAVRWAAPAYRAQPVWGNCKAGWLDR
ncbi:MAG: ThuA domain-containing protein [Planctomycetota bacterium]|nr:ThuA domain-containing protein [Planctomycetota bacterium]